MVEALGGQGVLIRSLGVPSDSWGSFQILGGPFRSMRRLGGRGRHLGGRGSSSDPWGFLRIPIRSLGSLEIPVVLRGQGEALGGWGVFMRSPGALEIPVALRGQGEALGGWERHLGGRR